MIFYSELRLGLAAVGCRYLLHVLGWNDGPGEMFLVWWLKKERGPAEGAVSFYPRQENRIEDGAS